MLFQQGWPSGQPFFCVVRNVTLLAKQARRAKVLHFLF